MKRREVEDEGNVEVEPKFEIMYSCPGSKGSKGEGHQITHVVLLSELRGSPETIFCKKHIHQAAFIGVTRVVPDLEGFLNELEGNLNKLNSDLYSKAHDAGTAIERALDEVPITRGVLRRQRDNPQMDPQDFE